MRGKQAPKRKILPDPLYKSELIAKLINTIMERGKKTVAQKIVYSAFDFIKTTAEKNPLDVFDEAYKNLCPTVEVKSRRVGGANYQIPIPVRGERQRALAFRWLIAASRAKKGKPMHQKLAEEILAAADNQGDAVRKRADVHRMAEANKAFAHFAR